MGFAGNDSPGLQQSLLLGEADQGDTAVEAEFFVDVVQVDLYRPFTDVQSLADLPVALAAGDLADDFDLPAG